MGVKFKEYTYQSDDYYKIGVYAGKCASWRKCKVCGKSIDIMTPIIGVHSFGEIPTMFHPKCILKIAKDIENANQSFEPMP